MSVFDWFRPARRLLAASLLITMLPAAALFWLSWRSLQQDRQLEAQRIHTLRETAADLIVTALQQRLATLELHLQDAVPAASDDAVAVAFSDGHIETRPPNRLLYHPAIPASREAPPQDFSRGEALEFRQQDHSRAVAAFRELAQSRDPAIRAGAHLRIARNLRKSGLSEAALAEYEQMARDGSVRLSGVPADLVARRARYALFQELKRPVEAQREADALARDLAAGHWILDRETFLHFSGEIGFHAQSEPLALADAVESLWSRRKASPSGRAIITVQGRPMIAIWHDEHALIAGSRYTEQFWVAPLAPLLKSQGVRLSLDKAVSPPHAERTASVTGLPWTLRVWSADPETDSRQFAARRRFLLGAAAMLSALLCVGSYFIARAVNRELALARLQSDFVSAVSHEFRTPLTLLRQTTEAFVDGRAGGDEQRLAFYQAQARATERLHRLVESLLDFGRMEAGAKPYRLQPTDATQLVSGVVEEFQSEMKSSGLKLELAVETQLPVEADPDALSHAIWNLLDNAAKYSPQCSTIWVKVARHDNEVGIAVCDRGLGIPSHEQKAIFGKFVRGAGSESNGIKGAGIGLSMVAHIVEAHHGRVLLESAPGAGSTFTILLPLRG